MIVEKKAKVILLNGPPSSGKDLSAKIIQGLLHNKFSKTVKDNFMYRPTIMKFADPIKMAVHSLYNIPYSCEYYEKEFGNDWKNQPQVEFFGKTPRSEYIRVAEEVKKVQDKEFFGRIAARRIELAKDASTFIFSDSGFPEEAVPLIRLVGLDNVLVIELERTGCDYSIDSRGYIVDELNLMYQGKLQYIRINNNVDRKFLEIMLKGVLGRYLDLEVEF